MTKNIKQLAIDAALIAGEILRKGYGTNYKISKKEGKNNLVTEYDFKSERAIIEKIQSVFPNHNFLAEESGLTETKNKNNDNIIRWIIDPLDGTVNFAHSIPIFSVSIAAELNNEIICGVVYQPLLKELFVAERGYGAFLNEDKIRVSQNKNISTSFCVTGFPYSNTSKKSNILKIFNKLIGNGIPVRRLGSAALDLSYVAAGRFDFFWEEKLKPWDVAAGKLLVEEAGGKITQYNGKDYYIYDDTILATNKILHNDCLELTL